MKRLEWVKILYLAVGNNLLSEWIASSLHFISSTFAAEIMGGLIWSWDMFRGHCIRMNGLVTSNANFGATKNS